MTPVIWTRPALADLDAIQDFIAQDNPFAAYRLAREIFRRAGDLLAANPLAGRPGRVSGTRELVITGTRYIVAYRIAEQVAVLAVLHGARDWPARFGAS